MQYYQKMKRGVTGFCNICGTEGVLKWDHVPPKQDHNSQPSVVNPFFTFDKGEISPDIHRDAQNGVKFRTVCEKCNSTLLGGQYDRSLIDYSTFIEDQIFSKQEVTDPVYVEVKINRLCRSICGHFLSCLVRYDDQNLIDKALREYFLNPDYLPPPDMQLLTWVYLYNVIVIQRNFVTIASLEEGRLFEFPDGLTSVMSSFPVSFVLHDGKRTCGLIDLFSYCTSEIDDVVKIPVQLGSYCYPNTNIVRDPRWPANISDRVDSSCGVLGSKYYFDDAIIATRSFEEMLAKRSKDYTFLKLKGHP